MLETLEAKQDLAGETVLITAGPTREPIDPVRYIGNRSSGKMGYALAEAAMRRGANVISGLRANGAKAALRRRSHQVQTAQQMRDAVMAQLDQRDHNNQGRRRCRLHRAKTARRRSSVTAR